MSARYLNVDCILRSEENLAELKKYLEKDVFFLWDEFDGNSSHIGFETNLVDTKDPEQDILEFLKIFDAAPHSVQKLITECNERVFDIGFESGFSGDPINTGISSSTVQRMAKLGFSIGIRIYPVPDEQ